MSEHEEAVRAKIEAEKGELLVDDDELDRVAAQTSAKRLERDKV